MFHLMFSKSFLFLSTHQQPIAAKNVLSTSLLSLSSSSSSSSNRHCHHRYAPAIAIVIDADVVAVVVVTADVISEFCSHFSLTTLDAESIRSYVTNTNLYILSIAKSAMDGKGIVSVIREHLHLLLIIIFSHLANTVCV